MAVGDPSTFKMCCKVLSEMQILRNNTSCGFAIFSIKCFLSCLNVAGNEYSDISASAVC